MVENNQFYYYHPDHLGTPQKMTDSVGTVVWAADYKPFGEATITISTITNNLRFPGQYFDSETGMHYNYRRDYKPTLGRYIETDPIGIVKGRNHLYIYVRNSPIRFKDPRGLDTCDQFGCIPNPDSDPNNWNPKDPAQAWVTVINNQQCPYIECAVKCESRVLIGEIRDAMLDEMIKEVALRVAKEFAQKALPYYGWYSTSMSVYAAAECLVNCYKK